MGHGLETTKTGFLVPRLICLVIKYFNISGFLDCKPERTQTKLFEFLFQSTSMAMGLHGSPTAEVIWRQTSAGLQAVVTYGGIILLSR